MSKIIIRQGDVLLQPVESIPAQFKEGKLDSDGSATLAHGEVTGHRHRFERQMDMDGSALSTVFFHPSAPHEVARVQLKAPQALVHEEHTAHELKAGTWRVSRPYEYEGAELIRMVED